MPPTMLPVTQRSAHSGFTRDGSSVVSSATHERVNVVTWNCRGLATSTPYLQTLASTADVICLQEHWLWPYEKHLLSTSVEGFTATAICDRRLDEHSELRRGCGGTAILWKKSLTAFPSPVCFSSDRICAVTISLSRNSSSVNQVTVISVYFPSADADFNSFQECIFDLEETVNSLDSVTTAVIIAGDFNAHLGPLAGPRGIGNTNSRGIALKQFIDRNHLFVASHNQYSYGPSYTYHSGDKFTTLDYMITNRAACSLLTDAPCIPDHSLNISDHLPLSISIQASPTLATTNLLVPKVDWRKAISTNAIVTFTKSIDNLLSPLLNNSYDDITKLDHEVRTVCSRICALAEELLPKYSSRKRSQSNYIKDDHLKRLYTKSKATWKEWKNAGRPQSGELLEKKTSTKKEIQSIF